MLCCLLLAKFVGVIRSRRMGQWMNVCPNQRDFSCKALFCCSKHIKSNQETHLRHSPCFCLVWSLYLSMDGSEWVGGVINLILHKPIQRRINRRINERPSFVVALYLWGWIRRRQKFNLVINIWMASAVIKVIPRYWLLCANRGSPGIRGENELRTSCGQLNSSDWWAGPSIIIHTL